MGQSPYFKVIQQPGVPGATNIYDVSVSGQGRTALLGSNLLGGTVTMFSDSASFLWSTRIAPASIDLTFIGLEVHCTPDQGVLVTGFTQQMPSSRDLGRMKFDANGNVSWTQRLNFIDTTFVTFESRTIILSNGDIFTLALGWNYTFASRSTSSGTVLWTRRMNDLPTDIAYWYGLCELSNGDILLRLDNCFARLAPNGDLLFARAYAIPGAVVFPSQTYFLDPCPLADGGFIFQALVDYYPSLIRCDAAGEVTWAKRFDHGDYYQPWFTAMTELPDGDLFAFPTSTWNRTLALRMDANGQPIQKVGVTEEFKLWPSDVSFWRRPYAGKWNNKYHFWGSVQQVYGAGFTPSVNVLIRSNEDLLLPCVSATGTFTSTDIVGISSTEDITTIQDEVWFESDLPWITHNNSYYLVDACPLVLSLEEQQATSAMTLRPSVVTAGESVNVKFPVASRPHTYQLLDMNGKLLTERVLGGSTNEVTITTDHLSSGLYLVRALDRLNVPCASGKLVVQ